MQILARLKKALIMVRAEFNQGSCTSQSKLELNLVSFRTRFHRDTIGLGRNPIRIRSDSNGIRSGSDEILLGFKRDSFRIRARPIQT